MGPELEAGVKGLTALAMATIGALLLRHRPRTPATTALAAFLALVAANQAAETARALVADPGAARAWFHVATFFAALDPLALLWFASMHPRPNALRRVLLPAAALAGLLALAAPLFDPIETATARSVALNATLALFTAAAYGLALLVALRDALAEPTDAGARAHAVALAIAALPVAPRLAYLAFQLPAAQGVPLAPLAFPRALVMLALTAALAAMLLRLARGRAPWDAPRARAAWVVMAAGLAAALLVVAPYALHAGAALGWWGYRDAYGLFSRASVSARWLLFTLLATVGVFRHDLLDLGVAARRRSARVVVAVGVVLAAALALGVSQAALDGEVRLGPEWMLLALVLAASQGVRRVVDHVAWRAYAVPLPEDAAGREEAYRRAAEAAARDGSPEAYDRLRALAEDLGIEAGAVDAIDAVAERAAGRAIAPGRVVARRYHVTGLLGRGGHGRIHLAHDRVLGRDVALKEVPTAAGDAERALREARAAASLSHPNVVAVHDVLPTSTGIALVVEHCAGGDLAARVSQRGELPVEEALRVVDETLEALAAVHALGIAHEDVKPSNLLLDESGRVKLSDFGLASIVGDITLDPSAWAPRGSVRWAAPEQTRGEPATPAADVYAVGLLARWLLGARALPAELERVVARALLPELAARWSDARAMREAWRAARQAQ